MTEQQKDFIPCDVGGCNKEGKHHLFWLNERVVCDSHYRAPVKQLAEEELR